jgi:cytochrome c-type biogenesis protein CcmE
MKKHLFISSASIVLSLLLFAGCSGMFSTPIGDLVESPRKYDGKHLKISGTVTERNSFFVAKYFVLKDKTGEIRVMTTRVLPNVGEKVVVHGRLKEAFSLGDLSALVFIEDPQEE